MRTSLRLLIAHSGVAPYMRSRAMRRVCGAHRSFGWGRPSRTERSTSCSSKPPALGRPGLWLTTRLCGFCAGTPAGSSRLSPCRRRRRGRICKTNPLSPTQPESLQRATNQKVGCSNHPGRTSDGGDQFTERPRDPGTSIAARHGALAYTPRPADSSRPAFCLRAGRSFGRVSRPRDKPRAPARTSARDASRAAGSPRARPPPSTSPTSLPSYSGTVTAGSRSSCAAREQ
jgi:hypothetical protein